MAFYPSLIDEIHFDGENPNYFVSGPFLIAITKMTLIRYFGWSSNVILDALGELGLTAIGPSAFDFCSMLESICIPAFIEIIGDYCFSACSSLSELTFESGSRLTHIGEAAFSSCSSLTSICIPAEVEQIPKFCFGNCTLLTEVSFALGSKLIEICEWVFVCCSSLRSIVFPSRLEIVRFCSLADCRSLSELRFELPSGMRELDLPPSDFGLLSIQDSVDVITGMIKRLTGQRRLLRFGRESHLRELDLRKVKSWCDIEEIQECPGNDVFVCHSEEVLRRFRFKFEGL
jgi:hypothetical protein